jgi:eukaryotic-like serine/threonine-protein kinase
MHPGDATSITRFGAFEIDRRTGELCKHGVRIRLRAQSFQVLTLLVDQTGEVVTREALQRHIWSTDTFVDFERGLNKAVNRLREALGDTAASPRFIETLPKRGYRFIAPVEHVPAAPETPAATLRFEPTPPNASVREPGRAPQSWVRWLAASTVGLAVAAGAGYAFLARRQIAAGEPTRIVLADVDNATDDRAFDGTVEQALVIGLEQSPAIRIVSEHEVARTLRLMQRPADTRLTPGVARDVCRRTLARAVLGGSVSMLGRDYVVGLNVVDCHTGEPIARQQVRASRKEDVLAALDTAMPEIRRRLGEPRTSIDRFDTRVHDTLTTGSLEAFEAYTRGERNVIARGGASNVPFFQRALELDPEFAYAHAALGLVFGTMGENVRSIAHTERAFALKNRVSEWERFFITAQYHDRVTGELDKVVATCDIWIQTYPGDRTAHNRLAGAYNQLGRPAQAWSELETARRVGRDHPIDVDAWAATAIRIGRTDVARPVVRQLLEETPNRLPLRRTAYRLAFVSGDERELASHLEWAARMPNADAIFAEQADTEAQAGRVAASREWLQRAVAGAVRNEFTGNAAAWTATQAVREALLGNDHRAVAGARAALALEESWETRALAALAFARAGHVDAARRLADALAADRPHGTLVQHYWLPSIRASADLHAGDAASAIAALQEAEPYELADARMPLLPALLRGEAFLAAGDGQKASAEFEKLLRHRGVVANSLLGPLARLGLGRALALAGDAEKARQHYATFFELWHGADPSMPAFRKARVEYEALRQAGVAVN